MTLQSDSSEATHWYGDVSGLGMYAKMCRDVRRSGIKGWGRVHSNGYGTLSIFGLPMGYSLIGSVRYILYKRIYIYST